MSDPLSTEEIKELVSYYHEREVRWTDKALNQLSFFNNLLLTLGLAFLSFSFKNYSRTGIASTCKEINWSLTMTTLSLILIFVSIFLGLMVTINRLLDFRITRHINQIRHRMLKHSQKRLDESTPDDFTFENRVKLTFDVLSKQTKISMEDCIKFKKMSLDQQKIIEDKFKEIRNIAHNLGSNAWDKTIAQIFFFGASILLYFIGIIIS